MSPRLRGAALALASRLNARAWTIYRGDTVMITRGKDRGETGVISEVMKRDGKVTVAGRNLVKKHVKKTDTFPGGTVNKEMPIHRSNVRPVDPVTGKAVRIATRFTEDGKKVRVTVGKNASGSILPKPAQLLERKKPRPVVDGPKDTAPDTVGKVTFNGVW